MGNFFGGGLIILSLLALAIIFPTLWLVYIFIIGAFFVYTSEKD
jgi:hypothetical protein